MEVKPAGEIVPGTGHHHIIVNGDAIAEGGVVPKDTQHIHYGKGETETELLPDLVLSSTADWYIPHALQFGISYQANKRLLLAWELRLQFHGAEPNDFCSLFGLPFIKAVSMLGEDPVIVAARYPDASGILLDSHEPGRRGGTGRPFDWGQRPDIRQKLWLDGGLNPENVGRAIRAYQPWAVDVSSGVEEAPGLKDADLIRNFMEATRQESDDQ